MDKIVHDIQINRRPLIPQSPSDNNHSYYKIHQLTTKAKNNEERNNKNNIVDYKNISLTMTGEISSSCIYRNNLIQKQPNMDLFIEEAEDNDEQFISNMKTVINNNYKMKNKENFSIRDLQSKSYLGRKKKCAFSDEDQNLIKRFKKSVGSKTSCVIPQKLQQPEHVVSVSNHNCLTTYTPQIIPVKYNDSDTNSRINTNELFFHVAKMQKNDQWMNGKTLENAKTVEIEIEQLIYHEMQYFTPPQKDL